MYRVETDAQRYGSHFASQGFNPEGRVNPHDVMQTGPGQLKSVGRFDPLSSSVSGGIFGGQADERPRGNYEAVQRVKALPTGGGDFLDRLAMAEARDSDRSDRQHAAGGRLRTQEPERAKSADPNTAYQRAAKLLNAHQTVADNYAQQQQARQWNAVQKQNNFIDAQAGGQAAGTKSRGMQAQENYTASQAQTLQQSWHQRANQHQQLKRQEQQDLAMQTAHAERERQQRAAIQRQQAQRSQQQAQQSAMTLGRQQQHLTPRQQQRLMQQEAREVAMKTQWAKNQAMRRNSSGGIRFG